MVTSYILVCHCLQESMLMLTELLEMVTVFERFFQLEYSESCTCMVMPELRGITTLYATWNTLGSELQLIHFNCGNYWCWLMLKICMVTVIVKLHVCCWKYHPCINWYNICRVYIHVVMRIYMSLMVQILPTLKLIFVQAVLLNTVVYRMLIVYTNVLVNSVALFKQ